MTPKQLEWLKANPDFQFVGQRGGMARFVKQTCVRPDGSSYLLKRGHAPADGEIHVGIREVVEQGTGMMPDPRYDTSTRSPGR